MSNDQTLPQSREDLRLAQERSLEPARPPLDVPGYQAERFLGSGAYGQVWVAIDTNARRRVAIKFYSHRGGLDWSLLSREVERLALLFSDRYVVQLVDVGWDADPPYFVMEYLENGSLAERLQQGPLPVDEAVELFREVATGLVHAHGKGVLHCDLKPANVLLDQDRKPRLADFGQSRLSSEQTPALGTLFYMAPEQADLQAMPDARWDVYALGALLYCMLTGEPPHRSAEAVARIQSASGLEAQLARYREHIVASHKPRLYRSVPGVDRELSDIVARCLAADPHKRFANPQAVLNALHARNIRKARRPLLVLGAVGPAVLLIVMSLFGWDVFETALVESNQALMERVLESDRFAAQFVAETVAREIDRRWQILEQAAAEPELIEMLQRASERSDDAHASEPGGLQKWLERVARERPIDKGETWYLLDARGRQVARSPDGEIAQGKNRAFRDYFHGQGRDLPPGAAPQPLSAPHLSVLFVSEVTHERTVALSVPVWSAAADAENRAVLGVLVHAIGLGRFAELRPDERSGNNRMAVLVDCKRDESGQGGAILEHPDLPRRLDESTDAWSHWYVSAQDLEDFNRLRQLRREPQQTELGPAQVNELAWLYDYRDPFGGEYAGRWLAAIEPVEVNVRSQPSRDTGWAVIVQERHDSAVKPVEQLRSGLLWRSELALAVVISVVTALWGFVVLVLNESPRLRWLRRRRFEAVSAGEGSGGSEMSPSLESGANDSGIPPPGDAAQTARAGQ